VLWVPDDKHEYGLRYRAGCTDLRLPILKDGAGHALTNTCDECVVSRRRCESFSGILLGVSWFQKKGLSRQDIPRHAGNQTFLFLPVPRVIRIHYFQPTTQDNGDRVSPPVWMGVSLISCARICFGGHDAWNLGLWVVASRPRFGCYLPLPTGAYLAY
jgi:hypothetical protein